METVAKFRQIDVLVSQGQSVAEAVRSIGVTQSTSYRWRKEFGALKTYQVKRLKELQKENERLRKAVSDLTLLKLVLRQAVEGMAGVFARGDHPDGPTEAEVKELHAKNGRLAVENDFLRRAQAMSPAKRNAPIRRDHPELSVSQQCRPVRLSRSAFYYAPVGIDAFALALMKAIDRVFNRYPFFGSRQIAAHLRREGIVVGRHRVRRLMAKMGLEAIYKRPRTSQPHPQHPVCPYLVRGMQVDCPNQVWCADMTFIPVQRGFLYLVAVMDWATRKVLSWQLSNTLHADFCVEALKQAIARFGPPGIMNTDQGSQFTGSAWITTLTEAEVRISMDGRGR